MAHSRLKYSDWFISYPSFWEIQVGGFMAGYNIAESMNLNIKYISF